jgi:hypothetical protein
LVPPPGFIPHRGNTPASSIEVPSRPTSVPSAVGRLPGEIVSWGRQINDYVETERMQDETSEIAKKIFVFEDFFSKPRNECVCFVYSGTMGPGGYTYIRISQIIKWEM